MVEVTTPTALEVGKDTVMVEKISELVVDAVPERPPFVSLGTYDEVGVCCMGVPTMAELSVRTVVPIGTNVVDITVEPAADVIVVRPVL
jgi:hypothetical protein